MSSSTKTTRRWLLYLVLAGLLVLAFLGLRAPPTPVETARVTVGPLRATATHPRATGIGWDTFAALREHVALPIYAIGGLRPDDVADARRHGAQGIAAIRGLWPGPM